jgi:hypothetical protein
MSVPDWIAAGAAVGAAVLVGWQSWETRKSAHAAAHAATTANSAIELSRSALEVARTEEGHTRRLIAEAVKNRIDATSPRMFLTLDASPVWPPFEPSTNSNGEPQPVAPRNKVFRLPRDGDDLLIVRQFFTLRNDSSTTMTILPPRFRALEDGADWVEDSYALEPGSVLRAMFDIEKSVKEWVEKTDYAFTGLTITPEDVDSFMYVDHADCGVTDTIKIDMWGNPLWPVENEHGAYRVVERAIGTRGQYVGIQFEAKPLMREYWLSRSKSIELQ